MTAPAEYRITHLPARIVGEGPNGLTLTVDGNAAAAAQLGRFRNDARMFMRNGIVGIGSPGVERVRWLVGELDGVRVYISQNADGSTDIALTRADVYPGGTDEGAR